MCVISNLDQKFIASHAAMKRTAACRRKQDFRLSRNLFTEPITAFKTLEPVFFVRVAQMPRIKTI